MQGAVRLLLASLTALGFWPYAVVSIDPDIEQSLHCSDILESCRGVLDEATNYRFLDTLALPAENGTAGPDLRSVRVRGPCVSAEGITRLLDYAPNATIHITTDNLVIESGAVFTSPTTNRVVWIFANRVTIAPVPGLAKRAAIRFSSVLDEATDHISLRDLLGSRIDGGTYRPLTVEAQNVSLNLGYMADDSSTLSITTLGAGSYRLLPQLRKVYTYDLSLTDYYDTCSDSRLDWLNLQLHACDAIKIPVDEGAVYPHLPFFCHTPYFGNKTDADFFTGQDPEKTRVHILDWDLSDNWELFQPLRSAPVFVANASAGILTEVYNYTWSLGSSMPPRSQLCRDNFTAFGPDVLQCPTGTPCVDLVMDRLSSACSTSTDCPEVLNTMWEASTFELGGKSRSVIKQRLAGEAMGSSSPDSELTSLLNLCWSEMMLSSPPDVSFISSLSSLLTFSGSAVERSLEDELNLAANTELQRRASLAAEPGQLPVGPLSTKSYLTALHTQWTNYRAVKDYVAKATNLEDTLDIRRQFAQQALSASQQVDIDTQVKFQQLVQQKGQMTTAIVDVQKVVNTTNNNLKNAASTLQDGISSFKSSKVKDLIFGFFSSIFNIFAGILSGNPFLAVDGVVQGISQGPDIADLNRIMESLDVLKDQVVEWKKIAVIVQQMQEVTDAMQNLEKVISLAVINSTDGIKQLSSILSKQALSVAKMNQTAIYENLNRFESLRATVETFFAPAVQNGIKGATGLISKYKTLASAGIMRMETQLNYQDAVSKLFIAGVQLTNSQNAQAGISDVLKDATKDLTSSVDVLHQLFFNVKQARVAMLTVFNEVCSAYISSTLETCPASPGALSGKADDESIGVQIADLQLKMIQALKGPPQLYTVAKSITDIDILDGLKSANTMVFDIQLDDFDFRYYYGITVSEIKVVFRGAKVSAGDGLLGATISSSGFQYNRDRRRKPLSFRGQGIDRGLVYDTRSGVVTLPATIYAPLAPYFSKPSPFGTWRFQIPEGRSSNIPGTYDLSGVYEVYVEFIGPAFLLAPILGSPRPPPTSCIPVFSPNNCSFTPLCPSDCKRLIGKTLRRITLNATDQCQYQGQSHPSRALYPHQLSHHHPSSDKYHHLQHHREPQHHHTQHHDRRHRHHGGNNNHHHDHKHSRHKHHKSSVDTEIPRNQTVPCSNHRLLRKLQCYKDHLCKLNVDYCVLK